MWPTFTLVFCGLEIQLNLSIVPVCTSQDVPAHIITVFPRSSYFSKGLLYHLCQWKITKPRGNLKARLLHPPIMVIWSLFQEAENTPWIAPSPLQHTLIHTLLLAHHCTTVQKKTLLLLHKLYIYYIITYMLFAMVLHSISLFSIIIIKRFSHQRMSDCDMAGPIFAWMHDKKKCHAFMFSFFCSNYMQKTPICHVLVRHNGKTFTV